MDAERLNLLRADLQAQVGEVQSIYAKVRVRADGFEKNEDRREALAFQLHNLYCAIEDVFLLIAEAFENRICRDGGWHVQLLSRMRQEIPGVRPSVIDGTDVKALDELRGFRHVFRHAYAIEIDPEKLGIVLRRALAIEDRVEAWVDRFLRRCEEWLQDAD
jgi:uncharacterized protein YutE (UPF0331/DUF86 family)